MITSSNTSVRKVPALAKKVENLFGWKSGSVNIDIGAGKYDDFSLWLQERGVVNFPYDPYNRTEDDNRSALSISAADTVTVSDVLNVIRSDKDRNDVLSLAYNRCRIGGAVYITIYEGDKSGIGRITKPDCWQENRRIRTYLKEVKVVFREVCIADCLIVCVKE